MRRQRTSGGVVTKYNWINDENAGGDLTTSYVHGPGLGKYLALLDGANPASGVYSHFLREANGSPHILSDSTGAALGTYAFTPYGQEMEFSGVDLEHLYTGHRWDADAQIYSTQFRNYRPQLCRWTSKEPYGLDGPNMYWYSVNNPVSGVDFDGRWVTFIAGGVIGAILGVTSEFICNPNASWGEIGIAAARGTAWGVVGAGIGKTLGLLGKAILGDGALGMLGSGAAKGIAGGGAEALAKEAAKETAGGLAHRIAFGTASGSWGGAFDAGLKAFVSGDCGD